MHTADDTPEYYRMREKRERELAGGASTDETRQAHQALAENYRLVAEEAERRAERPA